MKPSAICTFCMTCKINIIRLGRSLVDIMKSEVQKKETLKLKALHQRSVPSSLICETRGVHKKKETDFPYTYSLFITPPYGDHLGRVEQRFVRLMCFEGTLPMTHELEMT